jgi:hypothetical protein
MHTSWNTPAISNATSSSWGMRRIVVSSYRFALFEPARYERPNFWAPQAHFSRGAPLGPPKVGAPLGPPR